MKNLQLSNIYCMDFKEFLSNFDDKEIDLILIDPPYGIKIGNMNYIKSQKGGVAKRTNYSTHNTKWDEQTLTQEDINEIIRVSKNQVIFGANHLCNMLPNTKGWIVWDKRTHDKYTNDFADCELIWTSYQVPARMIRYLWSGMLQQDMKHKETRYHPTQKPIEVMKQIIERFTTEGMVVADCFCGSGSTMIASEILNRKYIGCDKDQKYVEITQQRIKEAKSSKNKTLQEFK